MRYTMAFDPQSAEAPRPTSAPAALFYPDDLLPDLQRVLAMLADLDVQFEIARDSLEEEEWAGSEPEEQRCRAQLEHAHRQAREAHLRRVAQL